jgi:hypothetical protein
MKKLLKLMAVSVLILTCWQTLFAQTTRSQRKAAKAAEIKKLVDSGNFVFEANYALPMGGGDRQLTDRYDLRVKKDSVIAYLPYFGRAYIAPPIGSSEGGIKFTSTNFNYKLELHKNGTWGILIKPKDNNISDWRDVQQLRLDISPDGYASLAIISSNRDPISFQGDIVAKDQ